MSASPSDERHKALLAECERLEAHAGLADAMSKASEGRFIPLGIDGEPCRQMIVEPAQQRGGPRRCGQAFVGLGGGGQRASWPGRAPPNWPSTSAFGFPDSAA